MGSLGAASGALFAPPSPRYGIEHRALPAVAKTP